MGSRTGSNKIFQYFNIKHGKFYKYLGKTKPENLDNVVETLNEKTGEKSYHQICAELFGFITGITFESKQIEFNGKAQQIEEMKIVLQDGKETDILKMTLKSQYASSFLLKTPNIDPKRQVILRPYNFEGENSNKEKKQIIGMSVFYEDTEEKITDFWTKDNPGKLPAPQIVETEQGKLWVWKERNEYLKKYINEKFLPKLPTVDKVLDEPDPFSNIEEEEQFSNETPIPIKSGSSKKNTVEEDDDLPF